MACLNTIGSSSNGQTCFALKRLGHLFTVLLNKSLFATYSKFCNTSENFTSYPHFPLHGIVVVISYTTR